MIRESGGLGLLGKNVFEAGGNRISLKHPWKKQPVISNKPEGKSTFAKQKKVTPGSCLKLQVLMPRKSITSLLQSDQISALSC